MTYNHHFILTQYDVDISLCQTYLYDIVLINYLKEALFSYFY